MSPEGADSYESALFFYVVAGNKKAALRAAFLFKAVAVGNGYFARSL
jgi:hypothetical protein